MLHLSKSSANNLLSTTSTSTSTLSSSSTSFSSFSSSSLHLPPPLPSPHIIKRIVKDLNELKTNPPEGIQLLLNEENITDIQAWILGSEGTPFEGGLFKLRLVIPNDFPHSPPKGFFITRIFHPNISKTGEICVNTLKQDWHQDTKLKHIFLVIKCLLIHPNPDSALNEEAAKLFQENYPMYVHQAMMYTKIHASRIPLTKKRPMLEEYGRGGSHSHLCNSVAITTPASKKIDIKTSRTFRRL
ncbi:hypothetical protein HMI54_005246 [Coelomomyces lativittatus]|nr:hypothetical protein HMI55_004593 [Coelomomyces lativittatus]KAJ1517541.1 hypothetical protein HMI54_005246 [Coelomomyces lativittatus]